MNEGLVEEIARELARQDGVDDLAWLRMDARVPEIRPWEGLRGRYAERARLVLGLPGMRRLSSDARTAAHYALYEQDAESADASSKAARRVLAATEEMKADGQRQMGARTALPTSAPWDDLIALGFTRGDVIPGDPLFTKCTLPKGWTRDGFGHSSVLDERGVRRVAVFYDDAFCDRRAVAHLVRPGHEARAEQSRRSQTRT